MKFELNKEQEFVHLMLKVFLGSSKPVDLLQFIKENKFNTAEILQICMTHKLLPILNFSLTKFNLKNKFPRLYQEVNPYCRARILRRNDLLNELVRVCEAFKKVNIKVLPYKGLILSHEYYKNPTLRDFVDIDLAIDEKDLKRSIPIMLELGYELHKEGEIKEDISDMRSYEIDFSWVKKDAEGEIIFNTELHWQPSHNVLWVPTKFDQDLMNKNSNYNIATTEITSFEKINHILLIIIHHGIVDGWGQYRHLLDMHRIIKSLDYEEFQLVIQKTEKHRIKNAFLIGIQLIHIIFEKPIPFDVPISNSCQRTAASMGPMIMTGELSGKWSEQKLKLKYYLKMRDSFRDTLKSLWRIIVFYFSSKKKA